MKKYAVVTALLASSVPVAWGGAAPAAAVPPSGACSLLPNVVRGTADDDVLIGTKCADVFWAYDGDDTVYGVNGNDVVFAGPGDDTVYAGPGADTLWGGPGADILNGESGVDDFPDLSVGDTRDMDEDFGIITW